MASSQNPRAGSTTPLDVARVATKAGDGLIGMALGGYLVEKEIDRGGMGTVYLAKHSRIDRRDAIKVLHPRCSGEADLVQRFFDEARAASTIKHPGIVEIINCDADPSGLVFIVMEYLEGESLAAALRRGSMRGDFGAIADAGGQIADAMAAAHARGIVHRDLKPGNVFLATRPGQSPQVKILDFGIAKLLDRGATTARTQAGTTFGTPLYMSPEQCRGGPDIGPASDIYSLGCMLLEMTCGRPPFAMHSDAEIMAAHLGAEPPRSSALNAAVPARLDALVTEMLAKAPEDRPASMAEVAMRLRSFGTPTGRTAALRGAAATPAPLAAPSTPPRPLQSPAEVPSGVPSRASPGFNVRLVGVAVAVALAGGGWYAIRRNGSLPSAAGGGQNSGSGSAATGGMGPGAPGGAATPVVSEAAVGTSSGSTSTLGPKAVRAAGEVRAGPATYRVLRGVLRPVSDGSTGSGVAELRLLVRTTNLEAFYGMEPGARFRLQVGEVAIDPDDAPDTWPAVQSASEDQIVFHLPAPTKDAFLLVGRLSEGTARIALDLRGRPEALTTPQAWRYPSDVPVRFERLIGSVAYVVEGAHLEHLSDPIDLAPEKLQLRFKVRMTNVSARHGLNTGRDFRLVVDGVPYAPTEEPTQSLGFEATLNGKVDFNVPGTARDVLLQVGGVGDDAVRVPVDLSAARM
jgi:serine/threonine-protein kinase